MVAPVESDNDVSDSEDPGPGGQSPSARVKQPLYEHLRHFLLAAFL